MSVSCENRLIPVWASHPATVKHADATRGERTQHIFRLRCENTSTGFAVTSNECSGPKTQRLSRRGDGCLASLGCITHPPTIGGNRADRR